MPLPAVGGLIGMGGGFSASATATSGATGGIQDTVQSSEFNFSPGGGSTSGLLVGLAATVAVVALLLVMRRR